MLTQLQLEGPELEPLLARVRNELGASARIVHAEKIRSGGVAGFFARERFELTVEVDTEAHRAFTAAQAAVAAAPSSTRSALPVEDLVARAGAPAQGGSGAAHPGAGPSSSAQREPEQAPRPVTDPDPRLFSTIMGLGQAAEPVPAAVETEETFRVLLAAPTARPGAPASSVLRGAAAAAAASAYRPPSDVLNPAAAVLATEEAAAEAARSPVRAAQPAAPQAAAAAPAPTVEQAASVPAEQDAPATLLELAAEQAATVSTESPSFASLMDGLTDAIGPDPAALAADPAARLRAAVVEGSVVRGATSTSPAEPVQPVTETPADPSAPHGPSLSAALPASVPVAAAHPGAAPLPPVGAPASVAPVAVVDLDVPAQRSGSYDAGAGVYPVETPRSALATAAAPPAPSADAPAAPQDATSAELARLGLPRHLQPSPGGSQLHTALRASLTRLPTAPPAINRAGGVLAIVGPLELALGVAREIADELGLPAATSVAVATAGTPADVPAKQVLHHVEEAADRRAAWRRRSNLTVVAVDAPLTATGAAEARAFLTALSPSATWGAVEATRKAQDVASWTRALGGVHALALTDVEDTADPAAVLELGIPVSRLGGRPATPRAWATLLTGRLAS